MNLVESSTEVYPAFIENPLKHIEMAGRICYKSEDKITDDSCNKFVEMIVKRGHLSVIEHANFLFKVPKERLEDISSFFPKFFNVSYAEDDFGLLSGNARAFAEAVWYMPDFFHILRIQHPILFSGFDVPLFTEDLDVQLVPFDILDGMEDENLHKMKHTYRSVKFVTNRGMTHECVRHRVSTSYSQESTRFCRYGNNDNGLNFLKPHWFGTDKATPQKESAWLEAMQSHESQYMRMLSVGFPPQDARGVLPIDVKTEIIMTTCLEQWKHVFKMRCANGAHPEIRKSMTVVMKKFTSEYPELDFIR